MTSPIIAPAHGKRIEVRSSGVHGKGVFALVPIAKGEIIIEYTGEVISWKKAQKRHPHDPNDPNHTFYFHVSKKNVIDALFGGNDARWINHSCAPNCEADEAGGRIFIRTLRKIKAGEELNYDYGLVIDRVAGRLPLPLRCGQLSRHAALSQGLSAGHSVCHWS